MLTIRGVIALIIDENMGLFTAGFIQSLSFLSLFLMMIFGNNGFILLLKESVDQELIRMASYDDLTNTLNRRTFIIRAKEQIELLTKEKKSLTFALFDVDYFKSINDQFGHDAGDRVLQEITERINEKLSRNDIFGRYGGDEFALLLSNRDKKEAVLFFEEIRKEIENSRIEGVTSRYTISVGIVTIIPDKNTQIESLYISADKALYKAKEKGRNSIHCGIYDTDDENLNKRG